MPRGNGGVLGPANIPTTSVAKGVWSLMEQQLAQRQGIWPAGPLGFDPYYEYTTLLLPGNGTNGAQNNTFLDGSTNNFTITRNGNTTQGTFSPFSQTGWGNYLETTNTRVYSNSSTDFYLGTSDFCYEGFIYATNTLSGYARGFGIGPFYNNINSFGVMIYDSDNSGYITVYFNDGSLGRKLISSQTLTLNIWNHIAVVRSGSNYALFLNGTRRATYTSSNAIGNGSATYSFVGTTDSSNEGFIGYASNVRLIKGSSVYDPTSPTINVPTAPFATNTTNQVLLTCQANRFVDSNTATTAKTLTIAGSPSVQAFSPFNPTASWSAATYGGSGYFDGSADYLSVAYNSNLQLGSSDFTIEFWFYGTVAQNNADVFISGYTSGTNLNYLISVPAGNDLKFYASTTGNSWAISALTIGTLTTGEWNHIAVTRSGSTVTTYLNGTVGGTSTALGSSAIYANTAPVYIAAAGDGLTAFNPTGYFSGFRIVKGTAITPPSGGPTSPPTAVTNTVLLLNFTNAGIYDATSKNDLETVGNAQISTAINNPFGLATGNMYFDGTGDYLITNVSTADLYSFGTGDWTVEFWVRFNNTTGDGCIFDTRNATDTLNVSILRSTTTIIFQTGGATRITSGTITSNVWYHVALARSGASTKMFIDGTQAGSTYTDTTSYTAGANRPIVGAVSLSGFVGISALNGYVNNLRVTKGYARYTANFTAPTAAFPTL